MHPSYHPEQRARLLLVDDEPFNLDLLAQELEDIDGLDIHTAANGQQALDTIAHSAPDLIFLDIMMPVMDGFTVLERLKASPTWRDIPVVVISAAGDMGNIVRAIEMGAEDFLPKPFEPAILLARLNALLTRKRLHDLEQQYLQSLERELVIGREIQAGFLPKTILQPEGWSLKAGFQAAREVAGDFYDVFEVEPGRLALLVGDVTDKGVGSALYMSLFRTLLRAAVMMDSFTASPRAGYSPPPEDRLQAAISLTNNYICQVHHSAMYATLFFGVLDTHTGQLCYLSAGHDPPYVLRDGAIRTRLMPTGPGVGILGEATFSIETLVLAPGDTLVLYSDGITDAQNPAGEMLGRAGWEACLVQRPPEGESRLEHLLSRVRTHIGSMPQYDDITLLVAERAGTELAA